MPSGLAHPFVQGKRAHSPPATHLLTTNSRKITSLVRCAATAFSAYCSLFEAANAHPPEGFSLRPSGGRQETSSLQAMLLAPDSRCFRRALSSPRDPPSRPFPPEAQTTKALGARPSLLYAHRGLSFRRPAMANYPAVANESSGRYGATWNRFGHRASQPLAHMEPEGATCTQFVCQIRRDRTFGAFAFGKTHPSDKSHSVEREMRCRRARLGDSSRFERTTVTLCSYHYHSELVRRNRLSTPHTPHDG